MTASAQDRPPPDDEEILKTILERLSSDSDVDASDIQVSVRGGRVVLAGTVQSDQVRRDAEAIAGNTRGVREVENRLKVEDEGTRPF